MCTRLSSHPDVDIHTNSAWYPRTTVSTKESYKELNLDLVQIFLINQFIPITQSVCNILTYISSINTWASVDSPLAQLVKELDSCLFLCVIRKL